MQKPTLLFIVGLPASGKSSVSKRLAELYSYPILEKDEIKEVLFDTIGFQNYPEKRRLDVVANEELLYVAGKMLDAGQSMIVVNNFRKDMEERVKSFVESHPCKVLFLFLKGDADVFFKRYEARDIAKARHLGHILCDHYPLREGETCDYVPTRESYREIFEMLGMDDFHIGCPEMNINTTNLDEVNVDELAIQIQNTLKEIYGE